MAVSRFSFLYALTTESVNRQTSSPHSAGWSESWWKNTDQPQPDSCRELAVRRAQLLPTQASIIGYRQQIYNLVGNRIVPAGSASTKINVPGASGYSCDLPQVALGCSGRTNGGPNTSKFTLRGMPDAYMETGEFAGNSDTQQRIRNFFAWLVSNNWCFVGRDLSLPSFRVVSIGNAICTLEGNPGCANGDYLRLHRVKDVNGQTISGSYRVTAGGGTAVMTLGNFNVSIEVGNSGTARKDSLAIFPFSGCEIGRASVRKVGAPFARYRGRASKKTGR